MAHGVVRTDKMAGTDVASMLVSVMYMGAASTKTAIDNGNVVLLNGLMTGEREVYAGVTPSANSPIKNIVLVAAPEVMYDERKKNLEEFENEAGKICRGYHLHQHDIFSVTKDALDGLANPQVGNVVELKAGVKMNVAASATTNATQIGKIIAVEEAGKHKFYVIEVA